LTGGIACGKTTVADFWCQWGAEIRDADRLAHALIAPGGDAVEAVLREFGDRFRTPEGGVDRNLLGQIVFAEPSARERLNALLHPTVIRQMRDWADRMRREVRCGVAVIPLLFEAGMEKGWDAVVSVVSTEKLMLKRLAMRGLSPVEAQARITSQWPVKEKQMRADRVIENNGSLAELETQCRAIWNDLFEQGD